MELQDMDFSENFDKEIDNFCFGMQMRNDIRMKIVAVMGFLGKKQKAKMDKELESVGMTATQVQVMLHILQCNVQGKTVTARDLEEYFRVKNSTISGILKRLEKKDLIERVADKNDRRNKQIGIKGGFAGLCGSIDERVKDEIHEMFRGFSEEELQEMFRLLTKLLHNMDQDKKEE